MKLLEIELLTNNLLETEKFYTEQLGFPVSNKTLNSISFIIGNSILIFTKVKGINPTYHFAFNIPHNQLEQAINWTTNKVALLKNSTDEIITRFDNWNAESIYFYDNNNNILELIARFDLNNYSIEDFKTSSIESISEIGIVTDQPLCFGEELITDSGLHYFPKGPRREDFIAMGDDNGLILIVRTNRNWYPTNDSAQKHFTRIKFSADSITKELTINKKNT